MDTEMTLTKTFTVTDSLTAANMGSGDLPVLATPALIAFMENTAMKCVADGLADGDSTVGGQISCSHLHPTAVGDTVTVTATLTEVEGKKLCFSITATDSRGTAGEATHIRFVVNRERFMKKLQ